MITLAQLKILGALCEAECLKSYESKKNTLAQIQTLDALCKSSASRATR